MTTTPQTLGIIGGSGMLGSAMLRAILGADVGQGSAHSGWSVTISNRSGKAPDWADGVTVTTSNADLIDASDVVLLCLPPAVFQDLTLDLTGKLVLSVMAGVDLAALQATTGADRVIRAMSSPAAEHRLAYTPWVASSAVTEADRRAAQGIFTTCGATDEIAEEALLDHFTAMTGPVPGFVAYFAEVMITHAVAQGIPAGVADKAIRQLFLASGQMLATGPTAGEHVQGMVDYAGTTAAGLEVMRASPLADLISKGLTAAAEKARKM